MDDAARESGAGEHYAAALGGTAPRGEAPAGAVPPWVGPVEHRADVRGLLRAAGPEPADSRGSATPSPGEAMALACSTMRLVESQLIDSGGTGLAAADLSTARAALREARELLDAAAAGLPDEAVSTPRRHRRRLGLARSRPDGH